MAQKSEFEINIAQVRMDKSVVEDKFNRTTAENKAKMTKSLSSNNRRLTRKPRRTSFERRGTSCRPISRIQIASTRWQRRSLFVKFVASRSRLLGQMPTTRDSGKKRPSPHGLPRKMPKEKIL